MLVSYGNKKFSIFKNITEKAPPIIKLGILRKEREFLGEVRNITNAKIKGGNIVAMKPIKLNPSIIIMMFLLYRLILQLLKKHLG